MKRLILDTNFLMIPHVFGVDIFEEISKLVDERHELVVFSSTIKELENIIKRGGKEGISAKIALELIKRKGVKIIQNRGSTDEDIIEGADNNTIVATNDRDLIKRLKDKNIKVIYLRGKNRLEMM
ncbi:MAG: DNA-binding protein [Candidatus Aenigmatarchaeota archaeon]